MTDFFLENNPWQRRFEYCKRKVFVDMLYNPKKLKKSICKEEQFFCVFLSLIFNKYPVKWCTVSLFYSFFCVCLFFMLLFQWKHLHKIYFKVIINWYSYSLLKDIITSEHSLKHRLHKVKEWHLMLLEANGKMLDKKEEMVTVHIIMFD